MPHPGDRLILRETVRGKYFWLLVSLLLMILVAPVSQQIAVWFWVTEAVDALVMIAAVYAVIRSHRSVLLCLGLMIPTAILKFMLYGRSEAPMGLVLLLHLLPLILLIYVMGIVLRDVLLARRVTADTIKGALCIYLLLGLSWALLYGFMAHMDPSMFWFAPSIGFEPQQMAFHRQGFQISVYYSLITLTTVGYGDVFPMGSPVRSLSALEAIIGQFFLTVLVARLVGMHLYAISQNERENKDV